MKLFATILQAVIVATATCQSLQAATGISNAPIIDLGYVKYAGYQNATAGINYYRGIPYAQSPVGELRWQRPRNIELNNNFTGKTVNATKIAPWCWQSYPESLAFNRAATVEAQFETQPMSEDCLILDVLVPSKPVNSNLPVLLQIHGGGYVSGSAQTPGDGLVNASNGQIMYVSIQYRLGMFGFLAGSEVMADGVANAGLLDQRSALEWIQRNIRAFGGNPNSVTIWGGSAGGGSVSLQLTAGGAYDDPPFAAAIPEYPWWQPFLNASSQEIQFQNTLKAANCTTLHCLRGLPEASLAVINQRVQNISYAAGSPGTGTGDFYFGPVVDGKFVQMLPDQAFKTGNFYRVPLLTDRDAYEGVRYSNINITTEMEETMDAQLVFPYASNSFYNRLYQLYPRSNYNSTFYQRVDWFSDFIVCCPTAYQAQAMSDSSYFNTSAVFKMIMSAGSELHAATQAFLNSNTTGFPAANNQTLAEILSSYWISFTIAHDPNPYRSPNAPFWPSYRGSGSTYNDSLQALAVTYTTISPIPDPDVGPKCDFFSSRGYVVRN